MRFFSGYSRINTLPAMPKILITTTSFQDTPGPHHDILAARPDVELITARGPLKEEEMLPLVGELDGIICGDDAYTRPVLEKCLPRLRVLSKYGIGLDKIDLDAAKDLGIPVCFTPGVNHTTVAEHAFLLMLGLSKKVVEHANAVSAGEWKRQTGHELAGKTLGIVGLGRIGKEVAKRARAFDMPLLGFDIYWPEEFAAGMGIERVESTAGIFERADIVTLHCGLAEDTRHMINAAVVERMKPDAMLINTSRGELVDTTAIAQALATGKLAGYGTDVLDEEPPSANHPLLHAPNCLITPHIGSRTSESVARQATKAVENLLLMLDGKEPHARAV